MGNRGAGRIGVSARAIRSRGGLVRAQTARASGHDRNCARTPAAQPFEECPRICRVLLRGAWNQPLRMTTIVGASFSGFTRRPRRPASLLPRYRFRSLYIREIHDFSGSYFEIEGTEKTCSRGDSDRSGSSTWFPRPGDIRRSRSPAASEGTAATGGRSVRNRWNIAAKLADEVAS